MALNLLSLSIIITVAVAGDQPSVPLQSQTTTTVQEGLLAGTVPMGIDLSRVEGKRPTKLGEKVR